MEDFPLDYKVSNKAFNLAQKIKVFVERLAIFLKYHELNGGGKIFFKNGRLLLELILRRCHIDLIYHLYSEEMTTKIMLLSVTAGGASGFTISWLFAGVSLVNPPLLILSLLTKSITKQIVNRRDYSKFERYIDQILMDDKLKKIRAILIEEEFPITTGIKMETHHPDKNFIPEIKFDSNQTLEKFIKTKSKEQLGPLKNDSSRQIKKFV